MAIPTEAGLWSVRLNERIGQEGDRQWYGGKVYWNYAKTALHVDFGDYRADVGSPWIEFGCQLFPGPVKVKEAGA